MRAEDIIARLTKVRKTSASSWTACCPSHEDKNPSLSIRETSDGMILIHCFAQCEKSDILAAIGLKFDDLFPEKLPKDAYKPIRKPFPAADVLEMLRTEVMIVWLASRDMAKGKTLSDAERERLNTAASRIEVAING